jgi:hypothetical protein
MIARLGEVASGDGLTFDRLGMEGALEGAVIELPFAFWQYFDASLCGEIPDDTASDGEVFEWLDVVADISYASDQGIEYFQPYYYQAFTQLGYPAEDTTHLDDLLVAPELPVASYLPDGVDPDFFDADAMPDVQEWVESDGSQLMFIYGQNDPWTAGKFELGGAVDSHIFIVPGGNHGSSIGDLPVTELDAALAIIERWSGVAPSFRQRAPSEPDDRRLLRPVSARAAVRY